MTLNDGKLNFPSVPDVAGIYRMTLCDAFGATTGVYVGEAARLARRFRGYRNPGPSQPTNLRMNPTMVSILTSGGQIQVETITRAEATSDDGGYCPLDLSWKAARMLVERAVEVVERTAGLPVLNR